MSTAESVPSSLTPREKVRSILEWVAQSYDVTVEEILGPERTSEVLVARRAAVKKIADEFPHWQNPTIGKQVNRSKNFARAVLGDRKVAPLPFAEYAPPSAPPLPQPKPRSQPKPVVPVAFSWTQARQMVGEIADRHGVSFAEIIGPRKHRKVLAARYEAIRAVNREFPGWSSPKIGRFFNRDHTSILSALGRLSRINSHELIGRPKRQAA
jgi:chromosomal replication initiation ATPase DnaA